jgi:hypothetical protein
MSYFGILFMYSPACVTIDIGLSLRKSVQPDLRSSMRFSVSFLYQFDGSDREAEA